MSISVKVVETLETTITESIELAPGIEAQRVTVTRMARGKSDMQVSERLEQPKLSDKAGEFYVVEPALLDSLQRYGWFAREEYGYISQKPFTRVQTGAPYQVVRIRSYNHTVYTVEGERLPVAITFDYINGRVSDYSFDLKGLLQHLQGREDCTVHVASGSTAHIHSIPYYNAGDTTGYHTLSFTWHPGVELYRQYCSEADQRDSFERFNVAHTLMGNDAFRVEAVETCPDCGAPNKSCDNCGY